MSSKYSTLRAYNNGCRVDRVEPNLVLLQSAQSSQLGSSIFPQLDDIIYCLTSPTLVRGFQFPAFAHPYLQLDNDSKGDDHTPMQSQE